MTDQEKRSAIKRLNERYTDIVREWGKDSYFAKKYKRTLEAVFGKDAFVPSKTDNKKKTEKEKVRKGKKATESDLGIQLISRKKSVRDRASDADINDLLKQQTRGQIKQAIKEEAEEESYYRGSDVSAAEVLENIEYMGELEDDNINFYKNAKEAVTRYWDIVGGKGSGNKRPSYTLISEIDRDLKKADQLPAKEAKQLLNNLDRYISKHKVDPIEYFFGE